MSTSKITTAITIETHVSLPDALDNACIGAGNFCDLCGFGNLQWADVEDSAGKITHLDGPLDLLSLQGRIRRAGGVTLSDYRCLLAHTNENGPVITGGRLKGGAATLLELTVTALSTPSDDARTSSTSTTPLEQKWNQALQLSSSLEARSTHAHKWVDNGDTSLPDSGDTVHHRQFGVCRVIRVDDEHITLQKEDGRIVRLGLSVLRFVREQRDDGDTIWQVSVNNRP